MKNYSIWLDGCEESVQCELEKDITLDVLIIGGGITGVSCAYELSKRKDLKVALVEKNLVGHGVTARTTGKLTFLQETIYSDLCKTYDKDVARKYLKSQQEAILNVKNIIEKEKIDCNYSEETSYVFTDTEKEIDKIRNEKNFLEEAGIQVLEHSTLPDKTPILYGISTQGTAVFHPLKYLMALKDICQKRKVDIYENTKITDITKEDEFFLCKASEHVIKSKKVILAVHYPYFLFPYLFPFKTTLEKSYVAAYKTEENLHFNAITSSKPTVSMRYLEDNKDVYKLYLLNSHNIAFDNNDDKNFSKLAYEFDDKPEYIWSNKDVLTSDDLPLIGEIQEGMFLATGYNTWGMTNGTLAGIILSDLVAGKDNVYQDLFNPKRGLNKKSLIKFPITLVSTIKSFSGSKLNKNKLWYSDRVKFIKKDGKSLGVYIDKDNKEHIVYNICPHLKCSLIFNEVEETWDCPCHGSRFDKDGHSIEGPSNYDICYKDGE